MSYILEAVKRAEQERSDGETGATHSGSKFEEQEANSVNWKKWLAIAIFVNALILTAWIVWQMFPAGDEVGREAHVDVASSKQAAVSSAENEKLSSPSADASIDKPEKVSDNVKQKVVKQIPLVEFDETAQQVQIIDPQPISPIQKKVQQAAEPTDRIAKTDEAAQQVQIIDPQPISPIHKKVQQAAEPTDRIAKTDEAAQQVQIIDPQPIPPIKQNIQQAAEPAERIAKTDELVDTKIEKQVSPASLENANTKSNQTVTSVQKESKIVGPAKIEPLPELLPVFPAEQKAAGLEDKLNSGLEPEAEAKAEPDSDPEPASRTQVVMMARPAVPDFAELPYSTQQKIPETRISVHIYNAEPDKRKVRINGQIYRQGEQVDDDLVIEEITPSSVVFDFSGTLFQRTLR